MDGKGRILFWIKAVQQIFCHLHENVGKGQPSGSINRELDERNKVCWILHVSLVIYWEKGSIPCFFMEMEGYFGIPRTGFRKRGKKVIGSLNFVGLNCFPGYLFFDDFCLLIWSLIRTSLGGLYGGRRKLQGMYAVGNVPLSPAISNLGLRLSNLIVKCFFLQLAAYNFVTINIIICATSAIALGPCGVVDNLTLDSPWLIFSFSFVLTSTKALLPLISVCRKVVCRSKPECVAMVTI